MAAELGKVRLGNLTGTLILRMDDGSEVEVGSLSVPVDAMVSVTMPARSATQVEQDRDADRREADEPEPPAPAPLDRERINALPLGSVIRDKDGDLYDLRVNGWHRTTRFGKPDDAVRYQQLYYGFGPYTLVSTLLSASSSIDR